jgi:hypothetical protein
VVRVLHVKCDVLPCWQVLWRCGSVRCLQGTSAHAASPPTPPHPTPHHPDQLVTTVTNLSLCQPPPQPLPCPVPTELVTALPLPVYLLSGAPGMARPSYYGIRLSGFLRAPAAGSYTLHFAVDDVARVWVNDVPVINVTCCSQWQSVRVNLVAGYNKIVAHLINGPGPSSLNINWDEGSGNVSGAWRGM